jgi:arylsulfatase A-like enzyme/Flp pilus assembly protein TadD
MKIFKFLAIVFFAVSFFCCRDSDTAARVTGKVSGSKKINFVRKNNYNVLLITIDTWRYDRLGIVNSQYVKTPHIDGIARKSFVFKRAFAHNPVTLPSHVNILTGTTPLYHGIADNSGFILEDKFLSVAEYLKEKKYETAAFIGAFPLDSRFGLAQGFDLYDDDYGTHSSMDFFFVERRAEEVIERSVNWISGRQSKWFAWVHLFDPHQPYLPPAPYDKQYEHDLYSGEVAYVDAQLGTLFDFLSDRKLNSDTLIIITGDHGEALGEKGEKTHAYFAYNNTILIPLIIHIPETSGGFIEENVCHTDIFPTICDLLDYKTPAHLQGESLLPIIRGGKRQQKKIYFESMTPYLNRGWSPLRGFIQEDIKFINLPIEEVYDLHQDIQENSNLAAKIGTKKFKADLKKLRNQLEGNLRLNRSKKIDPDTRKKLETLGYLSGRSSTRKKNFTRADDLKTLLPLQNKMLDALDAYQRGRYSDALKGLMEVVEKSPSFVLVYRNMANIYKNIGQVNKAVKILRQGLEKNPGNVNLMSKLGIMLTEAGIIDEAISLLELCVKEDQYDPEVFNYLGVAYFKKGDFKSALDRYRQVLELDHNYAPGYNNMGSLYLVAYQKNRDERAYEMAMRNFNKALEIDPVLYSALNGRASAYFFKNNLSLAQEDWKKAINSNPDFADPYFNIGVSYLKSGDKDLALRYFSRCKKRLYRRLSPGDQNRLDRLIGEASH